MDRMDQINCLVRKDPWKANITHYKVSLGFRLYVKDLPIPILYISVSCFVKPSLGFSYLMMKIIMKESYPNNSTSTSEKISFDLGKLILFED